MKIATWNVNSLKVRLSHVLEWLKTSDADILGLQEIKCTDENFPLEPFLDAGFHVAFSGQKTYNGVAIIAKKPIESVTTAITKLDDPQKRVLFATVDGIRIMNIYIPNGSEVGSDKYAYKLNWLSHMQADLRYNLLKYPHLVLMGDFNIAPSDGDVHDPEKWRGQILCSEPERNAFNDFINAGMVDTYLQFTQEPNSYSWWDYRQAAFRRNLGLRIDFILASATLANKARSCVIDKTPRSWERPSDHAPVIADFVL